MDLETRLCQGCYAPVLAEEWKILSWVDSAFGEGRDKVYLVLIKLMHRKPLTMDS